MYEGFGAHEIGQSGRVRFNLFFPERSADTGQYDGTADPHIASIRVAGTFQPLVPGAVNAWQFEAGPQLVAAAHAKGRVYQWESPVALPAGYYEYKYLVTFGDGNRRKVSDPCTRYGGSDAENAAFVIGGRRIATVASIAARKPLRDLVIYELMIDDFTAQFRGTRAPIDAIRDRLDHLQSIGVNAIEFMPWTAWEGSSFSWGYDPIQYFSVEHRYINDPATPADKLFYLKQLINECHQRGIHVILDMVLNHAVTSSEGRGFPYYWLYQDPIDCPYVGNFADTFAGFRDLNFSNGCTHEFIADVCKYWIDVFKIDGIRFDYTLGFYKADDRAHGLHRVISDVKAHLASQHIDNFSLILEHISGFSAIDAVNRVGATGCWFEPMREGAVDALYTGIKPGLMRVLDANRDFASGAPETYVESHDHTTLAWHANNSGDVWKVQPHIIALYTCPGAPMIHNGQEFAEQFWFPEPNAEGRVVARPLNWWRRDQDPGGRIQWLHGHLANIRNTHPALRSPNFHPGGWQEWQRKPNPERYGIDTDAGTVVFHRWGNDDGGQLERFIVVLNFSPYERGVSVPFSTSGVWEDLLSGWKIDVGPTTEWFVRVGPNWGHVFWKRG